MSLLLLSMLPKSEAGLLSSVPTTPKALSSSRHWPMYFRRFTMAEDGEPASDGNTLRAVVTGVRHGSTGCQHRAVWAQDCQGPFVALPHSQDNTESMAL